MSPSAGEDLQLSESGSDSD